MKENITYITIDSGALISTRAVFEEDVKTMFLYKIVKGDTRNIAKQEFVQYMDKFCKLYKFMEFSAERFCKFFSYAFFEY